MLTLVESPGDLVAQILLQRSAPLRSRLARFSGPIGLAATWVTRTLALLSLLVAVTGCTATPMRWQKPGTDAAKDEAECQAWANEQANRQLPYGNGPPLYGLNSETSMLQWKLAIDNERHSFAADLTMKCMRDKGFQQVPVNSVQGPPEPDA